MSRESLLPKGAKAVSVGGPWYPLKKVGTLIIGTFMGLRPRQDGKGEVADWQDDNRMPFTTPAPMMLARTLTADKKGKRLAVVFIGQEPTNNGQKMSKFEVGEMPPATKEEHWLLRDHPPEGADASASSEDDDLPF